MPISAQICFRLLISCLSSLSCLIHTCVVVVVHSLIWAAGVSTPPARRPGGWWSKDALGAAGGLQAARLSVPSPARKRSLKELQQTAPASTPAASIDTHPRGTSRRTPRHRCGSTPGGLHRMRLGAVCALQRCWTAQRGGRTLVAPWTTVVSSIYQGNMLSNHRFHDSMIAQNSLAPPSTSPLTPAAANRCLSCALREQPL
jgi:hypothetical protein